MEISLEPGFEKDETLRIDSQDRVEMNLLRVPVLLSTEFIRMWFISYDIERMGFNETRVRINERKSVEITMRVNSLIKKGLYSSPASLVNREGK
jgi:hypothetical protein